MSILTNYFKKMVFLIIYSFIIICNNTNAEHSKNPSSFSNLLKNTELIINCEVFDIAKTNNEYIMNARIKNILYGNYNSKTISITSKMANGFFLSHTPYLDKDNKYILFLKREGSNWIVTNRTVGIFNKLLLTDIERIINAYKRNNKLFNDEGVNDLIYQFNVSTQSKIKQRLTIDLENVITTENKDFIIDLYNSENNYIKIFALQMIGKLRIEEMRENIEELVKTSDMSRLKFFGIVSLGRLKNKQSLEVILPNLKSEEQGIRRVTIDALKEIGISNHLDVLIDHYEFESDFINRIAIIEAIISLKEKKQKRDVLEYIKTIENNNTVLKIINRESEKFNET